MKARGGGSVSSRTLKDGRTVWRGWVSLGPDPQRPGDYLGDTSPTFDTKQQAEEWCADRLAKRRADKRAHLEPSRELLRDYLKRWLEGDPDRAPKTAESYESEIRNHITPGLGDSPLRDLSPARIQRWLDDMRAGRGHEKEPVSAHTAAYCRRILRTALQDAVDLGMMATNIVDRTKVPKVRRKQVDAFTTGEIGKLIEAAKDTRFGPFVRFMMFSGLRRGEALGLRWSDIDMDAGTVAIERQRVAMRGGAILRDVPKTASGVRTMTLPTAGVDALRAQKRQQVDDKRKALKNGTGYTDEGWVFTTAEGGPCDPRHVSRAFDRIRKRADVRDLSLHSTRHTSASVQIAAGVPLEIISKRLGHKRVGITADLYGHLLTEADRAAADAVDAFLNQQNIGHGS